MSNVSAADEGTSDNQENQWDQNQTSSPQKLTANQKNAQKSTGPMTEKGKRNSSRNATKHGLLSKELVIRRGEAKENAREFQQLIAELIEDLQPQGRTELSLVEFIATCDWRLRRSLRAETAEIESGIGAALALDRVLPPADTMSKILRYQTAIHRQKMQALQLLEKLQQRRRNRPPTSADGELDAEEK